MIAREEARPPAIIGHSLGGLLARLLAARFPALVSHVVGLGSPVSVERAALRTELRIALRAGEALWDVLTDASPRCAMAECGCALNGRSPVDDLEYGYSAVFSRRDEVVDWRAPAWTRGRQPRALQPYRERAGVSPAGADSRTSAQRNAFAILKQSLDLV